MTDKKLKTGEKEDVSSVDAKVTSKETALKAEMIAVAAEAEAEVTVMTHEEEKLVEEDAEALYIAATIDIHVLEVTEDDEASLLTVGHMIAEIEERKIRGMVVDTKETEVLVAAQEGLKVQDLLVKKFLKDQEV
jgi:hypothetical protein